MKKVNFAKLFALLSIVMLAVVTTSCEKDDDGVDVSIIGTWTAEGTAVIMTIDDVPFIDYMVSLGSTEAEAQAQWDLMQDEMDMEGTVEFQDGGVFTANWVGEDPETGTWTLSGDNKVLTIIEGEDQEEMTSDVITLNASSLVIEIIETDESDMNEDGVNEVLVMSMRLSFTR